MWKYVENVNSLGAVKGDPASFTKVFYQREKHLLSRKCLNFGISVTAV